ncbi:MAG: glucose-1-phosphate adenylyltransferase subunit GlgD, partial [Lachnospiraceae bacterium]|nr:glucose-1-phosphate adenylyltransferase subunit GlgD [Lachnospiraceae bacterium]
MVKANMNTLGIIFPNSYDALVPELVNVRLMASIPFASRYRLIDFILSSMTHCGIDNISVLVNNNYHSLMDHLGSGREWDLVRKNGGLNIFPPFAEKESKPFTGRVGALAGLLEFLRDEKEKYVVMTDTNMAVNFNFNDMLREHIESGADVTVAYNQQVLPEYFLKSLNNDKGYYYTFNIENGRV